MRDLVECDVVESEDCEFVLVIEYTLSVDNGGWGNLSQKKYKKWIVADGFEELIEKAGMDAVVKREVYNGGRGVSVKVFKSYGGAPDEKDLLEKIKDACEMSEIAKKKRELLAKRAKIQQELRAIEDQLAG